MADHAASPTVTLTRLPNMHKAEFAMLGDEFGLAVDDL